MASPEMQAFYQSRRWRQCRDLYIKKMLYTCERCGAVTKRMIVHHKIYLDPETAKDPKIALNFDNLECLCLDCHNKEHMKQSRDWERFTVGANGEIIIKDEDK